MNYLKSIKKWSDENWATFGAEFLQQSEWDRDFSSAVPVFCIDGKRFLASFRHNIQQGAIGVNLELDIVLRLKRANAEGFIGFYSGDYSSSLDRRLRSLNIPVVLVSGVQISVLLPYFSSIFIDKYFSDREENSRWAWSYYSNKIPKDSHKPLYCICGCKKDILLNADSISRSAAYIRHEENKLYFVYGLKQCIFSGMEDNTDCGWVELNQILHPDQFNIWNGVLNDFITINPSMDLSKYFPPKRLFLSRILQRIRSVNAGFFMYAQEF